MLVGMPRTKSAHVLRYQDTAYWNGKAPFAHDLPSMVSQLTLKDEPESCPSSIDEVPVLDDPREWSRRRKVSDENVRGDGVAVIDDSRSSWYLSLSHMRPSLLTLVFLFINVSTPPRKQTRVLTWS